LARHPNGLLAHAGQRLVLQADATACPPSSADARVGTLAQRRARPKAVFFDERTNFASHVRLVAGGR
jgi:hypothetical protein